MRYVYVVCNSINWKVYVGQTINPAQRKAGHFCAARKGDDYLLPRAIRKYGEQNFEFIVLEECRDDQVDERERFWIAHFDSMSRERGYNLAPGGRSTSKEHHRKLSEALKGNKHCVGRKPSEKNRQAVSAVWKGKHLPESIKQRMSLSKKGTQAGEKNPMFGRCGTKSPSSKLSQQQVEEIRHRGSLGEKPRKMAIDYKVSWYTVDRVLKGITYT